MKDTIFEKIAQGEIPAYKIWESDSHLAFLSIGPLSEGHSLVIPKKNLGDYIFEMNDDDYLELMKSAKLVAKQIKEKMNCDRVLMWVEGYEVAHVHVHLLPSNKGFGFRSMQGLQMEEEDFLRIQKQLSNI
jgi:histidine triad (HIT) family protein